MSGPGGYNIAEDGSRFTKRRVLGAHQRPVVEETDPRPIAAAHAAMEASTELLRCVREADAVSADVSVLLLDAARLVLEIKDFTESEVYRAITRALDGDCEPDF